MTDLTSPPRPPSYGKKVGLVLQGGGALGSYQAGVYEALADLEYQPDWVAGISIGAINAAIIAGNAPENRVAQLRDSGRVSRLRPRGGSPGSPDSSVRGNDPRAALPPSCSASPDSSRRASCGNGSRRSCRPATTAPRR